MIAPSLLAPSFAISSALSFPWTTKTSCSITFFHYLSPVCPFTHVTMTPPTFTFPSCRHLRCHQSASSVSFFASSRLAPPVLVTAGPPATAPCTPNPAAQPSHKLHTSQPLLLNEPSIAALRTCMEHIANLSTLATTHGSGFVLSFLLLLSSIGMVHQPLPHNHVFAEAIDGNLTATFSLLVRFPISLRPNVGTRVTDAPLNLFGDLTVIHYFAPFLGGRTLLACAP